MQSHSSQIPLLKPHARSCAHLTPTNSPQSRARAQHTWRDPFPKMHRSHHLHTRASSAPGFLSLPTPRDRHIGQPSRDVPRVAAGACNSLSLSLIPRAHRCSYTRARRPSCARSPRLQLYLCAVHVSLCLAACSSLCSGGFSRSATRGPDWST